MFMLIEILTLWNTASYQSRMFWVLSISNGQLVLHSRIHIYNHVVKLLKFQYINLIHLVIMATNIRYEIIFWGNPPYNSRVFKVQIICIQIIRRYSGYMHLEKTRQLLTTLKIWKYCLYHLYLYFKFNFRKALHHHHLLDGRTISLAWIRAGEAVRDWTIQLVCKRVGLYPSVGVNWLKWWWKRYTGTPFW